MPERLQWDTESAEMTETRKLEKIPDKPLSCKPLVEILKRKLNGEKGIARKWLRCRIRELTKTK